MLYLSMDVLKISNEYFVVLVISTGRETSDINGANWLAHWAADGCSISITFPIAESTQKSSDSKPIHSLGQNVLPLSSQQIHPQCSAYSWCRVWCQRHLRSTAVHSGTAWWRCPPLTASENSWRHQRTSEGQGSGQWSFWLLECRQFGCRWRDRQLAIEERRLASRSHHSAWSEVGQSWARHSGVEVLNRKRSGTNLCLVSQCERERGVVFPLQPQRI